MENALSMEDILLWEPFEGRSYEQKLNRTKIDIHLKKGTSFLAEPCFIRMKGISKSGEFQMRYRLEENCFELLALTGTPFLHNGNLSFHSLLRRGDLIDLEYNRLSLLRIPISKEEGIVPLKSWPEGMFISLEGETGTGKTTLAKRLHDEFVGELSPFVHINLSAFSENLLESELFGHEKGSFTGAIKDKRGAVERANKGTLFIDEVDSLPLHLQVKLLTFLDEGRYQRVGGERSMKANCRIVFASGCELMELLKVGKLRKDLYFRLTSGFSLNLKPLRKDKKKILKLLENFENEHGLTLSKELKEYLIKYSWPGNIRQLQSHLHRKRYLKFKQSYLQLDDDELLLDALVNQEEMIDKNVIPLNEVKKNYCRKVLLRSGGSVDKASAQLGIAKSTLKRLVAA